MFDAFKLQKLKSMWLLKHAFRMDICQDTKVSFPCFLLKTPKKKTEQRKYIAEISMSWIRLQKHRCASGAIMLDIDDTLIDGNECVHNGFQFMHYLFTESSALYPIHLVTARPDDTHSITMKLLKKRGFLIPPDRLHMLPAKLYGKGSTHVEEFKWRTFIEIGQQHHGVVAKFGDKLWDVAHIDSLHTYLSHIQDKDCCIFLDPAQNGTMSAKLPGM